ncbi:MAG: hypothetical protein QOI39_3026 [Mycobacterium sp.]|nr:hypothetical protein [Mycobacterium sp.]
MPQSTIARIESGARQPSLPVLARILAAVDLEPRIRLETYDDHDDVLDARDAQLTDGSAPRGVTLRTSSPPSGGLLTADDPAQGAAYPRSQPTKQNISARMGRATAWRAARRRARKGVRGQEHFRRPAKCGERRGGGRQGHAATRSRGWSIRGERRYRRHRCRSRPRRAALDHPRTRVRRDL